MDLVYLDPAFNSKMGTDAADAGCYTSKLRHNKDYPRIQILTVEGLLDGTERIEAPPQINAFAMENIAEIGTTIAGEINPTQGHGLLQISISRRKKRRDIVLVHLENWSTTLQPSLILQNEDDQG